MIFSLIIVFITIGLGESEPAIHCQNKRHWHIEQLMFSRIKLHFYQAKFMETQFFLIDVDGDNFITIMDII